MERLPCIWVFCSFVCSSELAALNGHLGYLLSCSQIDINVKDSNGFTPSVLAGTTKDDEIMDYFEDGKRELLCT